MHILADENMPYVEALFGPHGKVTRVAGRDISADMLVDVDVLLVRSVTKVDSKLLAKANKLHFVGTATIGTDHVDEQLLAERGITFTNAPGCNAYAVCDYVLSSLLLVAERRQLRLKGLTMGVIGIGNIGKRLLPRLEALGLNVLVCDPPRAEAESSFESTALASLIAQSDIVTLHVPLLMTGRHKTHHLIGAAELAQLKPEAIIINACRGEVIDNQALKQHLATHSEHSVVLDVWENEPQPDPQLMALVDIATPHIAGYSQEGKAFGTSIVYDHWAALHGFAKADVQALLPTPELAAMTVAGKPTQGLLKQLVHAVYDVRNDDERMRAVSQQTGYFDRLRKSYPLRRELLSTQINMSAGMPADNATTLARLGFQCSDL
ncbi:4-phosphoerythronate dehydrogenase [Neiella marina]|uniref:Erythronate-4-phosphate dehydrogenase n=1 Tax=Neiella holothuriorum TaxID=2870530 RepID=A0ABS7EDS2_9GAMM|nr:4-phosphoerythronate dehydrogenase [Neiella holothuriorum]MBW8190410.1 4-phosphoerythronate dehydrogenase [Neiella holothuriorum]